MCPIPFYKILQWNTRNVQTKKFFTHAMGLFEVFTFSSWILSGSHRSYTVISGYSSSISGIFTPWWNVDKMQVSVCVFIYDLSQKKKSLFNFSFLFSNKELFTLSEHKLLITAQTRFLPRIRCRGLEYIESM